MGEMPFKIKRASSVSISVVIDTGVNSNGFCAVIKKQEEAAGGKMGKEIEKNGFQKVLSEIDEAVKPYNFGDGVLPGILIYDDTPSCGTYQLGIVDCSEESRKNDNNVEPVFTIRVNGCEQPEENISGDLQGVMKESDIPTFFIELGRTIRGTGKTFDTWFKDTPEGLRKILDQYLK